MSNIFDLFKKIEKKADTTPVSFIIAGLGNPGQQYQKTRHNVGFVAVDYIAAKLGVKIDRAKFHSLVAEAKIGEVRVLLMKPETYMNNSGVAIGEAAAFYKIPAERVLVLHDEISFDPGLMRIRRKGSAGGHNGLKSIIAHLASEEFPRVKIGVGKKPTPEYLRYSNAYGVGKVAYKKILNGEYTTDFDLRVNYLRKPQAEREREERLEKEGKI